MKNCARRCDTQSACNAFTYNQLHSACFLKRSANASTTFYALAVTGVKLSPSGLSTATDIGETGSYFVIIRRADSPGSDYSRIDHFSFENCRNSCEADQGCKAFTYNQARGVCFLKRAANQSTNFDARAITGIKLSSLQPQEKKATTAPVQPQISTPMEEAQAPQSTPPSPPQIATPSEQAQAPQPPAEAPKDETETAVGADSAKPDDATQKAIAAPEKKADPSSCEGALADPNGMMKYEAADLKKPPPAHRSCAAKPQTSGDGERGRRHLGSGAVDHCGYHQPGSKSRPTCTGI